MEDLFELLFGVVPDSIARDIAEGLWETIPAWLRAVVVAGIFGFLGYLLWTLLSMFR